MPLVPFYGHRSPEIFAIERAAMDRPGLVRKALDGLLPRVGSVLDIRAGDGATTASLHSEERSLLALEPDVGLPRHHHPWVRGDASALPFASNSFSAAYATWAYLFPTYHRIDEGLAEAARVVQPGGRVVIVNNLGDDEFYFGRGCADRARRVLSFRVGIFHKSIATEEPRIPASDRVHCR